ncbi:MULTISPECIES: hypothetical protein [unclassified Duganella]|uniref:hypothetical protein n=1 Tax=unclassified Duganella TaxID=2636909 RepID=UPI0012E3EBDA|nr:MULTISPECIES: hypothetical protein [unclassified Duganella]
MLMNLENRDGLQMMGASSSPAFKTLLCLALIAFSSSSEAGFAGGPYFLWVNASSNQRIEKIIEKHLNAGEDCGRPDMQAFPAPEWIPRDLINNAIVQEDRRSIAELDQMLGRTYPGYSTKGLDGVIVYSENPKPQLSNLVRGRKLIAKLPLNDPNNEQTAWRTFCSMVPPITRHS